MAASGVRSRLPPRDPLYAKYFVSSDEEEDEEEEAQAKARPKDTDKGKKKD